MGEDKADISIEFQTIEKGTEIKVSMMGDISPSQEEDYLADWQELRLIP
jgi:hypothetical protein